MNTLNNYHNSAMELAERALAKRAQGEAEESIALFEKALKEELRAIEELDGNNNPSDL